MSIQQVKIYDEFSSVKYVAPNLWEVENCFSPTTHEWLKQVSENPENDFGSSYLRKRLQLKFGSHDYAMINEMGLKMVPSLSRVCGDELSLMETKYWIDLPWFGCQRHEDSKDIHVSYQIYLYSGFWGAVDDPKFPQEQRDFIFSTEQHLIAKGTRFWHDPAKQEHGHQVQFVPNCGYISLNTDQKIHDVPGAWDTRISVMFQYARV